jgi:hypothetical protein
VIENLGHNSVLYDRVPLVVPDQRSKGQVAYHAIQIELNGLQPPPERQLSITQKVRASPVRESRSSGLQLVAHPQVTLAEFCDVVTIVKAAGFCSYIDGR